MTAEPGGEEPPGGKKTWLMAPEGMQGLALAIQRALRPKHAFTKTCQGVRPSADTHFEPRVLGYSLSCVRPHPLFQVGEKEALSAECVTAVAAAAVDVDVVSPPAPSHDFFLQLASVGWLVFYGRCVTGMGARPSVS